MPSRTAAIMASKRDMQTPLMAAEDPDTTDAMTAFADMWPELVCEIMAKLSVAEKLKVSQLESCSVSRTPPSVSLRRTATAGYNLLLWLHQRYSPAGRVAYGR